MAGWGAAAGSGAGKGPGKGTAGGAEGGLSSGTGSGADADALVRALAPHSGHGHLTVEVATGHGLNPDGSAHLPNVASSKDEPALVGWCTWGITDTRHSQPTPSITDHDRHSTVTTTPMTTVVIVIVIVAVAIIVGVAIA